MKILKNRVVVLLLNMKKNLKRNGIIHDVVIVEEMVTYKEVSKDEIEEEVRRIDDQMEVIRVKEKDDE